MDNSISLAVNSLNESESAVINAIQLFINNIKSKTEKLRTKYEGQHDRHDTFIDSLKENEIKNILTLKSKLRKEHELNGKGVQKLCDQLSTEIINESKKVIESIKSFYMKYTQIVNNNTGNRNDHIIDLSIDDDDILIQKEEEEEDNNNNNNMPSLEDEINQKEEEEEDDQDSDINETDNISSSKPTQQQRKSIRRSSRNRTRNGNNHNRNCNKYNMQSNSSRNKFIKHSSHRNKKNENRPKGRKRLLENGNDENTLRKRQRTSYNSNSNKTTRSLRITNNANSEEHSDSDPDNTINDNTNNNSSNYKPYIVSPRRLLADKKLLKQVDKAVKIINKGLDRNDTKQQRKYFTKLMNSNLELKGRALFRIGNSFEQENKWNDAIAIYQQILDDDLLNGSAAVIHHLIACIKHVTNIDNNYRDLMIQGWQYTVLDEYENVRQNWVNQNELNIQMMGGAMLALHLGHYYIDDDKYNDQSLIWYRRAMNALERVGIIHLKLDKKLYQIQNKKYQQRRVQRKRVNIRKLKELESNELRQITEEILRDYHLALVEALKKDNYVTDGMDLDNFQLQSNQINDRNHDKCDIIYQLCFAEFHANKDEFDDDFDEYLKNEIHQTFEMNYHYIIESKEAKKKHHYYSHIFTNYGTFLKDVLCDNNGAEKWYKFGLKYSGQDYVLHLNLGEIYVETKQYKKAIKYYQHSLDYFKLSDYSDDQCECKKMKKIEKTINDIKRQERF